MVVTTIPINFVEFLPGAIVPSGAYESGTNLHLGSKSSYYIEVMPDTPYTIRVSYILSKLTNVSNPWAWGRFYSYDSNYEPISALYVYLSLIHI